MDQQKFACKKQNKTKQERIESSIIIIIRATITKDKHLRSNVLLLFKSVNYIEFVVILDTATLRIFMMIEVSLYVLHILMDPIHTLYILLSFYFVIYICLE